jgi:hypothetical protein
VIELIGVEGSHEFSVASAIRDAFINQWPGLEESPADEEHVKIAANAKLAGYQVSDVDVVIGAVFARHRHFAVRRPIKDRDGRKVSGVKVRVQSLLCAIEVKGQDSHGISVSGDEVNVRYKGKWKSATDQNIKQAHALRQYFEDQHLDCWIYRCVVLDGIDDLPRQLGSCTPEAGAVASKFSAGELLTAIAGVNGLRKLGSEYVVSSAKNELVTKALTAPVFKQIVPSRLDRIRMDRLATRGREAERIAGLLGKQRVHIRGHGGTGKTILMLQAAHLAYEQFGRRCLILTYNTALAADIRRLLVMLGVPSSYEGGGVEVRTAMSFVYSWLSRLGVKATEDGGSFDEYEALCDECLGMIAAGAISRDDMERVIEGDPESLAFDAIVVDEAQDWPQAEAQLLAKLYGGDRISLADGREQLLRGKATDWSRTLEKGHSPEERSLMRCLRMKRNLGLFANTIARLAGINWEVEPNNEAAGGKVIIFAGSYSEEPELVEELVREARTAGNEPIDFLQCVPPAEVIQTSERRRSKLALALEQMGFETWDAVDERVREEFPRSPNAFRVLQYESSRGLEGWTTVLEAFDAAWDYKYRQRLGQLSSEAEQLADSTRAAAQAAWRWCMIPLTRPIDTLVIVLSDETSPLAQVVLQASEQHEDFVDIRRRPV